MGCNIHAYIEYEDLGAWEHWASLSMSRHYSLYGLLAGVRSGVPIFEARGLPDDIDLETRAQFREWAGDAHHMSWLTCNELETVNATANSDQLSVVIITMKALNSDGNKTRLVFWFDN